MGMMIKAEGIHLGNWILSPKGKYIQIKGIDFDEYRSDPAEYYVNNYVLSECTPIPLTPEILEKAGWKAMGDSLRYEFLRYRYYVGGGWFYIISDTGNEVLLSDEIEHVHQLQNLIHALTNTELEIKL